MRFAVCPLNYGILLGKAWTTEHHAVINCYTNEIRFSHRGKFHTIVAKDRKTKTFISVNAITKDHSKNTPLYAVMQRKTPSTNEGNADHKKNKDIDTLLNEFNDVFPEKLPKGLPPKRTHDFVIDLKEGSNAPEKRTLTECRPPS